MLLPTLVRWLSRWVSYLLFLPSFQRFPKQKWTLYLALALDMKRCPHCAGLSLAILDSILALSLGLYISMSIYSIDSCNITDLLHCCGSPVSRPSCHWSNSAAVPTAASTGRRGPATARPLHHNWRHNRGTAQYLRHTKIYFQQAYFQMLDIL